MPSPHRHAEALAEAQAESSRPVDAEDSWAQEHEASQASKVVQGAWSAKRDLCRLGKDVLQIFARLEAVEASVGTAQAQPSQNGTAPPHAGCDRYADVPGRLAALESANAALVSTISELQAELRARCGPGGAGSPQSDQSGDAHFQEGASLNLRDGGRCLPTEGSPPPPAETALQFDAPPTEEAGEEDRERARYEPALSARPKDKYDVSFIPDAYIFQDSVWDASILLFCRNVNGQPVMFKWDVAVLIFSFLLNLAFQALFLVIVKFDMLPNRDFDQNNSIPESLNWRAEYGHSLDESSGMSMIELLCLKSQKEWSFLKDQVLTWQTYTGHFDASIGEAYLIPGNILSLMSLFLWTMTCIREYRAVVEQACGLWMLPLPDGCSQWSWQFGRVRLVQDDGQISGELINMTKPVKISVLAIMTFPRLIMLFLLMLWGMQFVAETSSLADLVLNAIALAFVLDIDDFLASILLTKHVRDCCTEMKPLVCGYNYRGFWAGCTRRLVFKLVVWTLLLAIGTFGFLVPYYSVAQSTLDALCEGNLQFIVQGGNEDVPTTIIVDMADAVRPDYSASSRDSKYYVTCEADMRNEYFHTSYPSQETIASTAESETVQEIQDRAKAITLDYAFQDESLKHPPIKTRLNEHIEAKTFGSWGSHGEDYKVRNPGWSAANIQKCPRFQQYYDTGWRACTPMPELGAGLPNCTWTRAADLCDGAPPGNVYRAACDLSSKDAKQGSCGVYASFRTRHPYLNCDKVVNLTDVEVGGSLTLEVAEPDYFAEVLQTDQTALSTLENVFGTALSSLPDAVAAPNAYPLRLGGNIHFDVNAISLDHGPGGRRLQAGTTISSDDTTTTMTTTTATITVPGNMVLPFSILLAPDTLTADYISQANWTEFAESLNIAMVEVNPRLIVRAYVNHTSEVSHAYCSSYIWCGAAGMTLKPNAADIPGASEEVCCDLTCHAHNVGDPSAIPAACMEMEGPPSEMLRSDADLLATVAALPNLDVCCEEQLRCDVYDGSLCENADPASVLIVDAASIYQGVQSTPGAPLSACCSLSCSTVYWYGRGSCKPEEGLTLVSDPDARQPTIRWGEDHASYQVYDFTPRCCEPTRVLCEAWDNETDGCAAAMMVLRANANNITGEHHNICCTP